MDARNKPRCGNVVTNAADVEAWVNAEDGVYCPHCGAHTTAVVRGGDHYPRMKLRAHDAPAGIIPVPFSVHPDGAVRADNQECSMAQVANPSGASAGAGEWSRGDTVYVLRYARGERVPRTIEQTTVERYTDTLIVLASGDRFNRTTRRSGKGVYTATVVGPDDPRVPPVDGEQ